MKLSEVKLPLTIQQDARSDMESHNGFVGIEPRFSAGPFH
jgi:hypothetical protein